MEDRNREADPNKTSELAAKRTDLAAERTDMALARTIMAADRTLMSWVRTCLAMLSFGFAVYKFLVFLAQFEGSSAKLAEIATSEQLGIIMIGLGTLSMVLGLIEYYSIYRRFGKPFKQKLWGTAFIIGVITLLLAVIFLFAIIMKIF
jgi:putative membrane protein